MARAKPKTTKRGKSPQAGRSRRGTRQNEVMALKIPSPRRLDVEIKEIFARCIEKLGFVPNVLRAYTLRPDKFHHFRNYSNALMLGDSGLSKLEREMIAVTVSSLNHCYYCITAHGAAVRQLSGDPSLGEKVAMNYRAAPLSARQRVMLDFAAKLTETPDRIEEADRQRLRESGFSDEDIFDICDVTGFYNMTNRLASGVDMQPNPEYHKFAR